MKNALINTLYFCFVLSQRKNFGETAISKENLKTGFWHRPVPNDLCIRLWNKSTKDLQLKELNKNGEMRVTGKWASALWVSSYPRMRRSRRPAAVIELESQSCLRNNQRSVPLGYAADKSDLIEFYYRFN